MAKQSFENALEQLEKIVETLESGQLSLEASLKQFEEGMKLSKYCTQKLDETEKKISIIMEKTAGSIDEVPFETSDDREQE
jgi:exodeoxyribonuclease VII small subunit